MVDERYDGEMEMCRKIVIRQGSVSKDMEINAREK